MRRFLFQIPIIFMFFLLAGCGKDTPEEPEVVRPVKAMVVSDSTVFLGRIYPGTAKATEEAELAFDVNGTLIERPINVGDRVKKGQLLARLDARDYQNKLAQARANLNKARSDYNRARDLYEADNISKGELDRNRRNFEFAQADVGIKRKAVSDTKLIAPFDGTVSEIYAENFQSVLSKAKIVRVVDISKIEFVVNVPETVISAEPEIYKIKALVRFDAFPNREIPARIKEVATEASLATRTYPVTLIMDQPEGITILPGMAGKAYRDPSQIDQSVSGAVEIPIAAVFSTDESDNSFVWVIDPNVNTVTPREVTTGELTDNGILVTQGLEPGEVIATAGVHLLRENQKVRPVEE